MQSNEGLVDEGFEIFGAEDEKSSVMPTVYTIVFFAVVWLALNIWAAIYMVKSRNIYFWDASTYWDLSRGIASGSIHCSPSDIYKSICELDYNYIAALPGVVWTWIFGSSRMAYVLGLVNMYLMPAIAMLYVIAKKLSKGAKAAVVLTFFAVPSLMFMTLIGFVDVGGMLPCLLALYLYFTKKEKRIGLWRHIAIGALLVFVMLWRRWYAFFAVSFITAMAADAIIFRKNILGAIVTALTSAAILLLCFRGFVFDKLLADYGNLYSGYRFSALTDLKLAARYFGVLTVIALAAASVAAGIFKGEKKTVVLWVQMIVCFVMFISTQTHGQQHLLLYIPSLTVMALILIRHIDNVWLLGFTALLGLTSIISVHIPRQQPNSISEIAHYAFIPDFSMRSIVRSDADEVLALKRSLDAQVPVGDKLGVLASSFTLNEGILQNVEASLGLKEERENYIVCLPQVDSRDNDCYWLYNVNYMLVAYPAQTHLAPYNQRIVTEAVQSFEVYADFAMAFEEVPEAAATLDGMELRLYRRVREVFNSDKVIFEQRIR